MGKQEAKTRRREEDGSMDRLSELPQPILHHILCFLSQEQSIQTCVLSKSWRYLGLTRPKIELRGHMFCENKKEFITVLHKILQRYQDRNLSIQEFVLEFSPSFSDQSVEILENWMLFQKGVKIFSLNFFKMSSNSSLPSVIFQTQSLEELHLQQCHLNDFSIGKVLLNRLRTLSLKTVFIADETLNRILSSCPLIENVFLESCHGLTTIKVNEIRNLKRFECCCRLDTTTSTIEFNRQTLETIRISYYPNWYFRHHQQNNEHFPRLKSLSLQNLRLPTKMIFPSNFPCLEELELDSCDGLEEFRLSSPSIKRLTLKDWTSWTKADIAIDAPNILYFEFSGKTPPSPFSITTTSNEWKSRVRLSCHEHSRNDGFSKWFLKLNLLLKALTESHISLSLHCFFRWMPKIITYCDSYKPVQVEHLVANYFLLSSKDYPDSLNILFRTFRPRYIADMCLELDAKSEWQKQNNNQVDSLCKLFLEEIRGERMSHRCFWIHDLKEVRVETFDENAEEWRLVQGTSLLECSSMPNNGSKLEVRIRLKWRERVKLAS